MNELRPEFHRNRETRNGLAEYAAADTVSALEEGHRDSRARKFVRTGKACGSSAHDDCGRDHVSTMPDSERKRNLVASQGFELEASGGRERSGSRCRNPERSEGPRSLLLRTKLGCLPGIRTPISRFRADRPTIERGGNLDLRRVATGGDVRPTLILSGVRNPVNFTHLQS